MVGWDTLRAVEMSFIKAKWSIWGIELYVGIFVSSRAKHQWLSGFTSDQKFE